MEVVTPDDLPSYYANFTTIKIGPFDLDVRFAQVTNDAGVYKVTEVVHVWLSPQHAKAVLKLLSAQIEKYEGAYGELADLATLRETQD